MSLETHGNETTMNLNSVIYTNIINSPYYRNLLDVVTYQEIIKEAQQNVKSMEPFLKGTTPSTAWVLMFKLWGLPLTIRQLETLIDHPHSVYLRGIAFLYLRFVCKPDQLWDWLGPYLEDDQEIVLQSGVKPLHSTIGKMCYMLLNDQKFLGQMLPRIPVLVMRDLEGKLEPFAPSGRAKAGQRDHFKREKSDYRSGGNDRRGGGGGDRDRGGRDGDRYNRGYSSRDRDRDGYRSNGRDRDYRDGGRDLYESSSSRRYSRSRSRSRSRDRYSRRDDRDRYRSRSRSPGRR